MKEIYDYCKEFDRKRNWNQYESNMTDHERVQYMQHLLVGLMGEIGEFANEVKKLHRDSTWRDENLKEELTDTFIFVLKLALTLKMDLKEEFFKKMEKNDERFKNFITNTKL